MGTSNPTFSTPPPSSSSSSFSAAARSSIVKQKQVFLHEWWLEKSHPTSAGRRLSVGGCTERLGTRIFHSSAVLKRHNTVTLGTEDGILVKICGTINKSRTHENGFPREVCLRFLYGFPYDWEEFANQSFAEESTDRAIPRGLSNLDGIGVYSIDGLNRFSPKSFDDLPLAFLRDFSDSSVEYSATCALWKSMFKDILQKHGGSAKDDAMTENSFEEEIPGRQENSTIEQNNKGEDDISIRKGRKTKDQVMAKSSSIETPRDHEKSIAEQNNKGEHAISIRKCRRTKGQVIAESSSMEIPREHEKSIVEKNNKGEHDMPTRRGRREKFQKVTLDKGTFESNGPCMRSSTRSKNSRYKHEESLLVSHAGNTVFNATEITRKLKLRNRFVEVHVKHIP